MSEEDFRRAARLGIPLAGGIRHSSGDGTEGDAPESPLWATTDITPAPAAASSPTTREEPHTMGFIEAQLTGIGGVYPEDERRILAALNAAKVLESQVASLRESNSTLQTNLDSWERIARLGGKVETELRAEVERLTRVVEATQTALADVVVKATPYGTQEGGFIHTYISGTGAIHRAIALLQDANIVVRPGFDGRKPLTPEQEKAIEDFTRKMKDEVIPALVEKRNRLSEEFVGKPTRRQLEIAVGIPPSPDACPNCGYRDNPPEEWCVCPLPDSPLPRNQKGESE